MAKKFTETFFIDDFIFPNKGIGYVNDIKVEVKNALPGQKVSALVSKKRKKYEGKILDIIQKSNMEIAPECDQAILCGGCTFQAISYDDEVKIKKNMLIDLLNQADIKYNTNLEFIKSKYSSHYRNKMEYSFGDNEKGGDLCLGMRKKDSFYEVSDGSKCTTAPIDFSKIVKCINEYFKNKNIKFYHKGSHIGELRHLIIREGFFTKEIMINLVTVNNFSLNLAPLVDEILALKLNSTIIGVFHTENGSVADVVKVDKFSLLYGRDYFYEKINGLTFKVTPFSFFQTNSRGAEELYNTVKTLAGEDNDIIFDLYCGTGTIGQILSEHAKKVIGIEIVEEAVISARENAKLNNIDNATFIAGDVLKHISDLTDSPSLIILDPPREGIHPKAIKDIIKFNAKKIIYISCKPTSLMRDLKIFIDENYIIKNITLHDMFPRTYHVETIVLLEKE